MLVSAWLGVFITRGSVQARGSMWGFGMTVCCLCGSQAAWGDRTCLRRRRPQPSSSVLQGMALIHVCPQSPHCKVKEALEDRWPEGTRPQEGWAKAD